MTAPSERPGTALSLVGESGTDPGFPVFLCRAREMAGDEAAIIAARQALAQDWPHFFVAALAGLLSPDGAEVRRRRSRLRGGVHILMWD